MSFVDDVVVLTSTSSFAFGVSTAAGIAVVVCVAVCGLVFDAVSFSGGFVAPMLLSDDIVDVAVVVVGADVLSAVITALTAVVLSFKLHTLSRHFFFWVHLPCPGPGMLGVRTEQRAEELSEKLESWVENRETASGSVVGSGSV